MATKIETTSVTYSGHCPKCGKEQADKFESYADRICDKCKKSQEIEQFETKLDFLKGATIIDFEGECCLDWGGQLEWCGIVKLVVKTRDNRTIDVTTGIEDCIEHFEDRLHGVNE